VTFWELMEQAAREHPDRVLVQDEHGRKLTASALRDAAEQVAAGLGVQPGDVVSWQLPTVLESAVVLLALARVGAVQNPIIPLLREQEVRHITGQIGTKLFIVPTTWRGFDHDTMARTIAKDAGFEVTTIDLSGVPGPELRLPMGDPATLPPPPTDDHACRWIYYTSGTTSAPKGVRHTDASVIASSYGVTVGEGIREGDRYPIAWPYTHIGGVTMTASVLRQGGALVLFEFFDPATFGDRVAEVNPTMLGTGIPFFRAFLDAQKRHGSEPLYPELRYFVAGGGATPPEMVRELIEAFGVTGVVNSWGLTEFPIVTGPSADNPPDKLLSTVGPPSPRAQVRVVDGELRAKGPQAFLGYVDANLDAAAFDEDGWVRTGDLGFVDEQGFVTITGRLKDVIIRNNENISALEIEDVLLGHPDISDVTVIGLPDARTGERVCAVIVPAPGTTVTLESVAAHFAAQGIAKQKTPERIELVETIDRNPMGKALKNEIRERILAQG
jgi:acyl-CoA synthetase (AMP-forming)/AMP-acid ligase II